MGCLFSHSWRPGFYSDTNDHTWGEGFCECSDCGDKKEHSYSEKKSYEGKHDYQLNRYGQKGNPHSEEEERIVSGWPDSKKYGQVTQTLVTYERKCQTCGHTTTRSVYGTLFNVK